MAMEIAAAQTIRKAARQLLLKIPACSSKATEGICEQRRQCYRDEVTHRLLNITSTAIIFSSMTCYWN